MGPLRGRLAASHALPEVAVLAGYLALSLAVSWPLAAYFTTAIPPGTDAVHNLWVLWHVREWVAGRQPLFELPLLYFPYGASLLTHGLGPVTGIFALPFWPWGPAAAHNGAALVSLTLTGWCMYLLARDMGFERPVAFLGGIFLLTAPICLVGLLGHMTKVFLGGLPLTLLFLRRALDPARSRWWACGVAGGLLLLFLHAGYQFVIGALLVGLFMLLGVLWPERGGRRVALLRNGAVGVASAVALAPLLIATQYQARQVAAVVGVSAADIFAPDLLHFVLPYAWSYLLGPQTLAILQELRLSRSLETAVWLPWVVVLLGALALWRRLAQSWRWALVLAAFVCLSLGSDIRLAGTVLAEGLRLPTPYTLLASLPGLGFIRVPGRFMFAGYVAFAVLGVIGLQRLLRHAPAYRMPLLFAVAGLHLLLVWPKPWPYHSLPVVPAFYRQIASESEQYGVFDVPLRAGPGLSLNDGQDVSLMALSQWFQIAHGKGITGGYISRRYGRHPLFPHLVSGTDPRPPDLLLDGRTPNALANAEADLARYGYRYVVVHHDNFVPDSNTSTTYTREQSAAFVAAVFGARQPLVREAKADVYAVDAAAPFTTTIGLLRNWYGRDATPGGWRWAVSPAELYVAAPARTPALLELLPSFIHSPASPDGLGTAGVLRIDDGASATEVPITAGAVVRVPVVLPAGTGTISLTLAAGNFSPRDFGGTDPSLYSFALNSVQLHTIESFGAEPDLLIAGRPQREAAGYALALDTGWYARDESGWRWANPQAGLLVYSETASAATLRLLVGARYDPAAGGLGDGPGQLRYSVGGGSAQAARVRAGEWAELAVNLQPGWNRVTLDHLDGAFRPADADPASGDTRALSFAAAMIELVPGRAGAGPAPAP